MEEQENRSGIGAWPWIAMGGGALAVAVRIGIMLRHPGGDGRASANFHPWILWAGLPALALSLLALTFCLRSRRPQGTLIAGFVAFFNVLMIFISL